MIILEHSTFSEDTIGANLGAPEYSYWFVRKAFGPILQRFGMLVPVMNPDRDADRIFESAHAHGQRCVLFAFNAPQYTPTTMACPIVPVFAWEFDTIPDETWNGNQQEDWRIPLARTGLGVTHSQASAEAVRRSLGSAFPVWSIPAPIFDRASSRATPAQARHDGVDLMLEGGLVLDAGAADLSMFGPAESPQRAAKALRRLGRIAADPARPPQSVSLRGVVYTAVLNPADGRKNWTDLVTAFVWAFRKNAAAVLILKLTHSDVERSLRPVLAHLSQLAGFSCKVILVHGMLSSLSYASLIEATSYTVNTSHGEGQCLPLMEFMSAGCPAVTPRHTAMLDYVTSENSFVVASRHRPAAWPHDERLALRCLRHEISFTDLVRQFQESWRVADEEPQRYQRMSAAAVASLRGFCSDVVVEARISEVLARVIGGGSVAEAVHGARERADA